MSNKRGIKNKRALPIGKASFFDPKNRECGAGQVGNNSRSAQAGSYIDAVLGAYEPN
jgi:hypothetical protein